VQSGGVEVVAIDIGATQPAPNALDQYLAASSDRAAARPALIIWPESALTTDIEHDRVAWAKLTAFVASTGTPLLAGGPGARRTSRRLLARFNSAHLLDPGRGLQSYHKRYLVPFAERWPSILGDPPSELASLEPGRETTVLHAGDISFGVLICFEIADSRGARTLASRGARFIVNLTNDAWFYRSSAPHIPWAVVRAVETGIPVVRAANAGVSAVFDRFGRTVATGPSAGLPSVLAVSLPAAAPHGATARGTPRRTHRGRSAPSPSH
jgi:apolipoprotein N-acyltransferase